MSQVGDGTSFGLFGGNHTLDHILGSVNQAATTVDLKELGLDLETLDFGQLGSAVKMEPADVDMDANVDAMNRVPDGVPPPPSDTPGAQLDDSSDNAHLAEQLLAVVSSELMDIGEMPMDMDATDWLESLMPPSDSQETEPATTSQQAANPADPQLGLPIPVSAPSGPNYIQYNGHSELDLYDPLLSNSQSPFDLLFEDSEFKVTGDLGTSLNWDKVDFAT